MLVVSEEKNKADRGSRHKPQHRQELQTAELALFNMREMVD